MAEMAAPGMTALRLNWFLDYVPKVNTILSIALNVLLIGLVLKRKTAEIGSYRYLMATFALCDLMVATTHLLVEPAIFSIGACVVLFSRRITGWRSSFILMIMYVDSFCCVLIVLLLQFVYRYLVVKRGNAKPWFTFPNIFIWIFLSIGILSTWHIAYWNIPRRAEVSDYANATFYATFNVPVQTLDYAGFLLYTTDAEGTHVKWDSIFVMGALMTVCSVTFSVIIGCGFQLYKTVRKVQSSSRHARTIVPVIFLYLPCTVFFLAPIVGFSFGQNLTYLGTLSTLFPVLDPLVIAYCVKDYRQQIGSFLRIKAYGTSPTASRPSDSKHRTASVIPVTN